MFLFLFCYFVVITVLKYRNCNSDYYNYY